MRFLHVATNRGEPEPVVLFDMTPGWHITEIVKAKDEGTLQQYKEFFEDGPAASMRTSYSQWIEVPDDYDSMELP